LLESLLAFIGEARAGDALHVAIYEARYVRVLAALAQARQRGVAVKIVYDAKDNGDSEHNPFPRDDNIDLLADAGLLDGAFARTRNPGYIAHNKFIVLSRAGGAAAVWTGSTNWSENGFFGQLNTGHEIWQPAVAAAYLAYWRQLAGNPEALQLREDIAAANPLPASWPEACTPVFSPRASRVALDRYIAGIEHADAVFVTLAFSIDDALGAALRQESPGLRYVLMDGIKGNKAQVAALAQTVRDIRATEAARVAIGAYLRGNALDQFLLERRNPMATHVQFVHTKFMLIDPLGAAPLVITGSANFSNASCKNNDENMVVVAGDTEVADIYLGEFMRSYTHYAFRDAVASSHGQAFSPKPLNEDRTWAGEYYGEGFKSRQRRYFAHAGEQ
jgi:phosphatidylserine/phosphatidylglycerophosphate/cardiolipin synthase-like enzyme